MHASPDALACEPNVTVDDKCKICCWIFFVQTAMLLNSDGTVHWHKDESSSTTNTHWQPSRSQANPVDIEMTAYALLMMAAKGDFTSGMPIMKWITSQRNSNGGFSSTQVTKLNNYFVNSV